MAGERKTSEHGPWFPQASWVNQNIADDSNAGGWIDEALGEVIDMDEFARVVDQGMSVHWPSNIPANVSQPAGQMLPDLTPNLPNVGPDPMSVPINLIGQTELKTPQPLQLHDQFETPLMKQHPYYMTESNAGLSRIDEGEMLQWGTETPQVQQPSSPSIISEPSTSSACPPYSPSNSAQRSDGLRPSHPHDWPYQIALAGQVQDVESIDQRINPNVEGGLSWYQGGIVDWTKLDPPFQPRDLFPSDVSFSPGPALVGKSATSAASSYCCSECHKEYSRKSDLDHHVRYHGRPSHECPVCRRLFHFPKDVRRHYKIHNVGGRTFVCQNVTCEYHTKGFKRSDHLKRHNKNVHGAPAMSRSNSAPAIP